MKNGFTLVELSIALVIIGLLIGGLLVGRTIMESAAVNATVSQIGKFDSMTMAFKSKYKYLPGDAPAFGGDGDGVLDWRSLPTYDNHLDAYTCEMPNFWNNIDPTQYKPAPCGFPNASTTVKAETKGPNKNVPAAKIGSSGSFFVANSLGSGSNTAVYPPRSYYIVLHGSQLQTNLACGNRYEPLGTTVANANSPLAVSEMMALDGKMDDGVANTGNVLSGNITTTSCSGYGAPHTSPLAACSSGANYTVSSSGYQCTPLIRIGAMTGALQ